MYITQDETVQLSVGVVNRTPPKAGFRQRVYRFYKYYQPDKLDDPRFLDQVVSFYKGDVQ